MIFFTFWRDGAISCYLLFERLALILFVRVEA